MIRVAETSVTHLASEDDVESMIEYMTLPNHGGAKTMTMAAIIFHIRVQIIGDGA